MSNAYESRTITNKAGARLTFPDYAFPRLLSTDLAVFRLASDVECGSPDTDSSPGAAFLQNTYDAAVEAITSWFEGTDEDNVDLADFRDTSAYHEVADGAPSVYTHARWQQFVDLQAYQEDIDDMACGGEDMTTRAGIALYRIAERVIDAVLDGSDVEAPEDEEGECDECGNAFDQAELDANSGKCDECVTAEEDDEEVYDREAIELEGQAFYEQQRDSGAYDDKATEA